MPNVQENFVIWLKINLKSVKLKKKKNILGMVKKIV